MAFDYSYKFVIKSVREKVLCLVRKILRGDSANDVKEETKTKFDKIIDEGVKMSVNTYLVNRQNEINKNKINQELMEIREKTREGMYKATIKSKNTNTHEI